MGKCHLKKRFEITSIERLIEDGVLYLSQLSPFGPAAAGSRLKQKCQNVLCTGALSSSVKKKAFYTALLTGNGSINDRSGADIIEATPDLKRLSYSQLITLFSKISHSSRTRSTEAACDQAHVGFRQSTERLLEERLVSQIQTAHQYALGSSGANTPPAFQLPPYADTRSQTNSRYQDEQAAVSSLTRNDQCGEVGRQILLTLGLVRKLTNNTSKMNSNDAVNEWSGRFPWRVPLGSGAIGGNCMTSTPTTPAVANVYPARESPSVIDGKLLRQRSRAAVPSRTGRAEEIFLEIPSLYITLKLRGPNGDKYTDRVYTHVIETGMNDAQQIQVEILSYTGGTFRHLGVKASAGRCINELKHILSQSLGDGCTGGGRRILKSVSSTRSSQSHCSGVSEVLVKARANLKKRRQGDQENVQPPVSSLSTPPDARARTPSEIRLALEAKSNSIRTQTGPQKKIFNNKRYAFRSSAESMYTNGNSTLEKTAVKENTQWTKDVERIKRSTQTNFRTTGCNQLDWNSSQIRKSPIELSFLTPAHRLSTITSVAGGSAQMPTSGVNSQGDINQLSAQLTSTVDCPELVLMPTSEFAGRFQTALTSVPTSYRTLTTSNNSGGMVLPAEFDLGGAQPADYSPPSFCLSRIGSQELQKEDAGDVIRRSDVYVVKRRDF